MATSIILLGHVATKIGAVTKATLKRVISLTPYRVVREHGLNRFEAVESCLLALKARGYLPRIIIDGGANVGTFTRMASATFPRAEFHLIEPQRPCHPILNDLCRREPRFHLHPVALSDKPGPISFTPTDRPNTGAHVVDADIFPDAEAVSASTVDSIFQTLSQSDRCLLKLDVEGHELQALRGATRSLQSIEIVLAEVRFISHPDQHGASEIVAFLDEHGFDLYDIAALHGRSVDNRARLGDFLFVNRSSPLAA